MGGQFKGFQDQGAIRPSDEMRAYDDAEMAIKQRPRLMEAFVLPDHDLTRQTYPGHAPSGIYGDFGPRAPPQGNRNGDVLGGTYSVLNVRTAAKNLAECQKYIDLGCDVNEPFTCARNGERMGWSVLHFASQWDRVDVVKLLLENGANPLKRSWEGETPLVIARKRGNWAVYRILETFIKTSTKKPPKPWGYEDDEEEDEDGGYIQPMDGVISQDGVVSPYKSPTKSLADAVKAHIDETDDAVGGLHYSDPEYLSPSKVQYAYDYATSPRKPINNRQYDLFDEDEMNDDEELPTNPYRGNSSDKW